MAWDKNVYPITAKMVEDLKAAGVEDTDLMGHKPIGIIVDTVGAYEHGNAEVEDVSAVFAEWKENAEENMDEDEADEEEQTIRNALIQAYADVALDLALSIHNQS